MEIHFSLIRFRVIIQIVLINGICQARVRKIPIDVNRLRHNGNFTQNLLGSLTAPIFVELYFTAIVQRKANSRHGICQER